MFTITFENQMHNQWTCEYVFGEYQDAIKYLKGEGFILKGGLFVRSKYNWSAFTKAYITPRKVWK